MEPKCSTSCMCLGSEGDSNFVLSGKRQHHPPHSIKSASNEICQPSHQTDSVLKAFMLPKKGVPR
jgi:hypothetical protein